jgi:hypothetical protein
VRVGDGGAHGPSLPRRSARPVRARTHLAEAFAPAQGPRRRFGAHAICEVRRAAAGDG